MFFEDACTFFILRQDTKKHIQFQHDRAAQTTPGLESAVPRNPTQTHLIAGEWQHILVFHCILHMRGTLKYPKPSQQTGFNTNDDSWTLGAFGWFEETPCVRNTHMPKQPLGNGTPRPVLYFLETPRTSVCTACISNTQKECQTTPEGKPSKVACWSYFKHLQTSSIQTFETSSDLSLFRHWRFLLRLTSGKLGSLRSKTSLRPKSAALEPTMRDTMRHLQHLKDSPAGSLLRHMPVHNPWPVINQKNATNALQKLGQAILTHLERLTISYDNVSDKRQMTPQSYAHASSSWMQILPGRPSNCPEKTTMPVSSRAEQTELWDMGPGNGSIQSWNILELLWNCCRLQYL